MNSWKGTEVSVSNQGDGVNGKGEKKNLRIKV